MKKALLMGVPLLLAMLVIASAFDLTKVLEEGIFIRTYDMQGNVTAMTTMNLNDEYPIYGYCVSEKGIYLLDYINERLLLYNNNLKLKWSLKTNAQDIKYNSNYVIFSEYNYGTKEMELYCFSHEGEEMWKLDIGNYGIQDVYIDDHGDEAYVILVEKVVKKENNISPMSEIDNFYLAKVSTEGQILWKQELQGNVNTQAISFSMTVDDKDNIYIIYSIGTEEGFISKYLANGILLWREERNNYNFNYIVNIEGDIYIIGSKGIWTEEAPVIIQCKEGENVFIEKMIESNINGKTKMVVKGRNDTFYIINENSDLEWEIIEYCKKLSIVKRIEGNTELYERRITGFETSRNNDVIIRETKIIYSEGGKKYSVAGDIINKYNQKGKKEWEILIGSLGETGSQEKTPYQIYDICINKDDDIMIIGSYYIRNKYNENDEEENGCGCI